MSSSVFKLCFSKGSPLSFFRFQLGNLKRLITRRKFQESIDPSAAVTIFAQAFDSNHFIVKFLREYDENPDLDILSSSLGQFHRSFCPNSTEHALDLPESSYHRVFTYPWGVFGNEHKVSTKECLSSRFCGPSTDDFIISEGLSIIKLYNDLKHNGYKPMRFPNSFIQGVWMIKKNGDRKFVVLQGNHRLAILSHLGFTRVDVRCDQFLTRYVKEASACSWPEVISGNVSLRSATEIFNAFFTNID